MAMQVCQSVQMLRITADCLTKALTLLNQQAYLNIFVQVMNQTEMVFSEEYLNEYRSGNNQIRRYFLLEILFSFYKRRSNTQIKQEFDNITQSFTINFLMSELSLRNTNGSKLALKILKLVFTQFPVPIIIDQFENLLSLVINSPSKLEKYQVLSQMFSCYKRCGNVMKREQTLQKYMDMFGTQFNVLFQFVLNEIQNEQDFNNIGYLFQIIRFCYETQFCKQIDNNLTQSLLAFSQQTAMRYFDSVVKPEDLVAKVDFQLSTDNDISLFTPLDIILDEDYFDLADQIIRFWQSYYRSLTLEQLYEETLKQQADLQFSSLSQCYQKQLQLVTCFVQYDVIGRQSAQQIPECIGVLDGQLKQYFIQQLQNYDHLAPSQVNTALWCIERLIFANPDVHLAANCINFITHRILHSRTQSEFYKMIKTTINRSDFLKTMLNEAVFDIDPSIIQPTFELMTRFTPEFFYYAEIADLVKSICTLLSSKNAEYVSKVFGQFFAVQIQQQNIQLKQLIDLMEIFGNIFIWKEAEIEQELYLQYLTVILQILQHYYGSFQSTDCSQLESVCQSLQYLCTNASTIDNFIECQEQLMGIFTLLVNFVAKFGDDYCYLVSGAIFCIADAFMSNDNGQAIAEAVIPVFQGLMEQPGFNSLAFTLRLCCGHCFQGEPQEEQIFSLLELFFQRPVDLDAIDLSVDVVLFSAYIFILNLSSQCRRNLLAIPSFAALDNHLRYFAGRICDHGHFVQVFLTHLQVFAQLFGGKYEAVVQELAERTPTEMMHQKVTNKIENNVPDLPQIYKIDNRERLVDLTGEMTEIYEMRGIFEKIKVLSIEIKHLGFQ